MDVGVLFEKNCLVLFPLIFTVNYHESYEKGRALSVNVIHFLNEIPICLCTLANHLL